jgi:hypothetical protein
MVWTILYVDHAFQAEMLLACYSSHLAVVAPATMTG